MNNLFSASLEKLFYFPQRKIEGFKGIVSTISPLLLVMQYVNSLLYTKSK